MGRSSLLLVERYPNGVIQDSALAGPGLQTNVTVRSLDPITQCFWIQCIM